jgi:hypothetical protein
MDLLLAGPVIAKVQRYSHQETILSIDGFGPIDKEQEGSDAQRDQP